MTVSEAPGRSVLIVDDNRPLRALHRMILKKMGGFAPIAEAEDGEGAIAEATRLRPDLILLDLLMPVMDGFEALPVLRRVSPTSRILVMTMLDQDGLEKRVLDLGADALVDKSEDETSLAARIRCLLGSPVEANPTSGGLNPR